MGMARLTLSYVAMKAGVTVEDVQKAIDEHYLYTEEIDGETFVRADPLYGKYVKARGHTFLLHKAQYLTGRKGTYAFAINNIRVHRSQTGRGKNKSYTYTCYTPDGQIKEFKAKKKEDAEIAVRNYCSVNYDYLKKSPRGRGKGKYLYFTNEEVNLLLALMPDASTTHKFIRQKLLNAINKVDK